MTEKYNKKTTYFITGGGTGGHIYPAVAVADYLNTLSDNEIYYIGNPKNLEHDIIKNYPFLPVNVSGLPRKMTFSLIPWIIKLCLAVIVCTKYILKYKPDLVFGTGGYVSAPCLIAAKILGVPFMMHDCDAKPGLVTRYLSKYASGVSLAFESAKKYINNSRCYVNGNPIRDTFKTLTKEKAREKLGLENKLTICIMGGSQGAKSINDATVNILKELSEKFNAQVIFQTGQKNFETTEENLHILYPKYKEDKNLLIAPYFNDMVTVLRASDIAVSRAGSLSISELCASNIATIFVPYPYAASDHQRINAHVMEENNAGIYIEDEELTSELLLKHLTELINDRGKLSDMQKYAGNLAKYNGTLEIVKQFENIILNN